MCFYYRFWLLLFTDNVVFTWTKIWFLLFFFLIGRRSTWWPWAKCTKSWRWTWFSIFELNSQNTNIKTKFLIAYIYTASTTSNCKNLNIYRDWDKAGPFDSKKKKTKQNVKIISLKTLPRTQCCSGRIYIQIVKVVQRILFER